MSILVVGIQGVSQSYYEAARIDGASKVQQFFYITLPGILPNLGSVSYTHLDVYKRQALFEKSHHGFIVAVREIQNPVY